MFRYWFGIVLRLARRLVVVMFIVFVNMAIRCLSAGTQRARVRSADAPLEFNGNLFVDRARVRLFLLHAQFGQHVDDDAGLYFQFPSQLVDSDFLHRRDC
jgi:hypothetical protein